MRHASGCGAGSPAGCPRTGRTPLPSISIDRDEIVVTLQLPDVEPGESEAETEEARAGRASAFREETREQRMAIAREAQRRYERTVSWGGEDRRPRGAVHPPRRPDHDPAPPAAAPGARHPGRRRRRAVARRRAGVVRPAGRPARGRLAHRAACGDEPGRRRPDQGPRRPEPDEPGAGYDEVVVPGVRHSARADAPGTHGVRRPRPSVPRWPAAAWRRPRRTPLGLRQARDATVARARSSSIGSIGR